MKVDLSGRIFRRYFSLTRIARDLVVVAVFSTFIAAFLTLVGLNNSLLVSLIMSQSYGISVFAFIAVLLRAINPKWKVAPIALIFMAGVLGGYFSGSLIGVFVVERLLLINSIHLFIYNFRTAGLVLVFSAAVTYYIYSTTRIQATEELIRQEKIDRLSSEKESLEANLRLLQAQIEPHFLFNTLSNVLSLIDTDQDKSKTMLSDLIRYLRTSLSRTLPAVATLGQEIDMIQAYLGIQQVRMGERLSFSIDVSKPLVSLPFPPMLLQPLVENSIKHGLESRTEGGAILIRAVEADAMARIEVRDTGSGFSSIGQPGIGISNVRKRIELIYGEKGRLLIQENSPHGVCAILEVPKNVL
jgi:sensor histidine kinase YesM